MTVFALEIKYGAFAGVIIWGFVLEIEDGGLASVRI